MGIDVTALRALLYAKACGVDFSRTLTLGRQSLHFKQQDAPRYFREFNVAITSGELAEIFSSRFADGLLQYLGAKTVDAIDASAYQEASVVHDLNLPIPESLKSRYSLVVDGGTLEHVFNFPVAAGNLIELTAPGGHILSIVPANNFCGHGFYQFSPELFFRTFSRGNGCQVVWLFLATIIPGQPWYEVTDPHVVHDRVTLQNYTPTNMVMLATRCATARQRDLIPQQSDYEFGRWEAPEKPKKASEPGFIRRLPGLLPMPLQTAMRAARELTMRSGFRRGYRRVTPQQLAREAAEHKENA